MIGPIILGGVLLAILLCSIYLAHVTVYGRRQTLEESWTWQMEHSPATQRFKAEDFEGYTVTGVDGYVYHCAFLPAKIPTNRYVILVHGYTDTRWGMLKYLQFYATMNVNCILYDQRGHGMNRPTFCTYSLKESECLKSIYEDARRRFGEEVHIGLHGESLGGATILESMKYGLDVDFYVDDCGFVELMHVLKHGLSNMHLPRFLAYTASLCNGILHGFFFWKVKPLNHVVGNEVPILFMHGASDDLILPSHSQSAYDVCKGEKYIHLFKGAGHAQSAEVSPQEYREVLETFLRRIGFI